MAASGRGPARWSRRWSTPPSARPAWSASPTPRSSSTALDRLGPGRALMVGDRLESDLAGAHAAGIDGAIVLTGVTHPRAGRGGHRARAGGDRRRPAHPGAGMTLCADRQSVGRRGPGPARAAGRPVRAHRPRARAPTHASPRASSMPARWPARPLPPARRPSPSAATGWSGRVAGETARRVRRRARRAARRARQRLRPRARHPARARPRVCGAAPRRTPASSTSGRSTGGLRRHRQLRL